MLTAGDNVTISGSGNIGSPYIINANITPVSVSDTATVDLTLTGQNITAEVILDPDVDNLLGDGSGLTITCVEIRGCLSAGQGTAYDDSTGVISAEISTDDGNVLAFGGDDGLYVPAGSNASVVGCGITGDGTGLSPLSVDTGGASWPYSCDETAGDSLYCNSDTNALHGSPPALALAFEDLGSATVSATPIPGTLTTLDTISYDVVNPSTCYVGQLLFTITLDLDVTIAAGARVLYAIGGNRVFSLTNSGSGSMSTTGMQVGVSGIRTVAAGATETITEAVQVQEASGSGSTYTRYEWRLEGLIVATQ